MNDSSMGSPLTQSLEPPERALPPETPREKIANAALILTANTKTTFSNAFQPVECYERAMKLLADAIDQLDQAHA